MLVKVCNFETAGSRHSPCILEHWRLGLFDAATFVARSLNKWLLPQLNSSESYDQSHWSHTYATSVQWYKRVVVYT